MGKISSSFKVLWSCVLPPIVGSFSERAVCHASPPAALIRSRLNGTLATLLKERPQLKTLMLHNIDTLGADLDPGLLGHHLKSEAGLSFEVITRRLEDRGGGLARVNKRPRLLEGLALPREEDEFALSYYNSMTTCSTSTSAPTTKTSRPGRGPTKMAT